jgi:hypothetical protein
MADSSCGIMQIHSYLHSSSNYSISIETLKAINQYFLYYFLKWVHFRICASCFARILLLGSYWRWKPEEPLRSWFRGCAEDLPCLSCPGGDYKDCSRGCLNRQSVGSSQHLACSYALSLAWPFLLTWGCLGRRGRCPTPTHHSCGHSLASTLAGFAATATAAATNGQ